MTKWSHAYVNVGVSLRVLPGFNKFLGTGFLKEGSFSMLALLCLLYRLAPELSTVFASTRRGMLVACAREAMKGSSFQ